VIVQKAVTPQMSWSYLARCQDTVSGYVTNAADLADATTPAALYALLGLGFPGSPHRPDAPHLDVLRFESTEMMTFANAIGGRTAEEAKANDGPFVERPPFNGLGFTAGGQPPVPLWFLDHCRLPPGAELWRIRRDLVASLGAPAYATVERSGDMRLNGGSVAHLHVHFVALEPEPAKTVRFRVSARGPDEEA